MRFSVVIPMFNGESTIVRAVASVLAQTHPAIEVVVVDDGSTDGGATRVSRHFPTVTVVAQENQGEGAARNAGVAAATHDWIAFLDADDFWMPWHLEHLAALISGHPDARMVAGAFAPLLPGRSQPDVELGRGRRIDYFREAAGNSGVVHSSTAAIHREAFDRTPGFGDALVGADLEMWARVALVVPVAAHSGTSAVYSLGVGISAAVQRAESGRELRPVPTTLAELSPSAAVVVEALRTGRHLPPARSLRRYLDARLAWAMRSRIAAGDLDGARTLRSLADSTTHRENIGPMAASYLPTAAVGSALRVKRAVAGIGSRRADRSATPG